jgi:DNA-binding CsgD family transcriptional regulator
VLRDAAEHALEQQDTPLALECLRLAERACTDEVERAATRAALVRAQWPFDPITADRHVSDLLSATRAGHLGGRSAVELVTYLIWNGRTTEAVELLHCVEGATQATDSDTISALHSARMQLAYAYPAVSGQLLDAAPTSTRGLENRVVGVVDSLLTGELTDTVLIDAERVLQRARLDASDCVPVLAAMDTLTRADRLDTATRWCDALLREADERRAPAWRALRSAACAVVFLRRGDLAAAELHARAALSCVRPKSLGVFIGIPLSILLQVAAKTGIEQDGLDHLNVPVPQAMFQTPFGLRYIRARGRFYLSQNDPQAAMVDFKACRDLAIEWGLDRPEFLTWRTDLAEAHLALGQPEQARELCESQLHMLSPYHASTRVITLRVLATASDPVRRSALLREAIEVLEELDDRLQLAGTLQQLSDVQRELGDRTEARDSARLATYAFARQRAKEPWVDNAARPEPTVPHQRESSEHEDRPAELSDAEQRVAELAVQGHTNQQIASKLYVTVSTVEQHLTRVYRKLEVNSRKDLAQKMLSYSSSAGTPLARASRTP